MVRQSARKSPAAAGLFRPVERPPIGAESQGVSDRLDDDRWAIPWTLYSEIHPTLDQGEQ